MFCIEEKTHMGATCTDCFDLWTEGDYYPHFQHVKDNLLQRALYCHIKHTFNFPDRQVEWGEVPNKATDSSRVIWWRCTEYTLIEIAGFVTFQKTAQGTLVSFTLLYNQPDTHKIPANTFANLRTAVQTKLNLFQDSLEKEQSLLAKAG